MTPATENPAASQDTRTKTSWLKGFFSFDTFITARLVKVIYFIGVAVILLVTIGGGLYVTLGGLYTTYAFYERFPEYRTFSGMLSDLIFIILRIPISIVSCVLSILFLRLYCEFILVIFKINENLQTIRNQNGQL